MSTSPMTHTKFLMHDPPFSTYLADSQLAPVGESLISPVKPILPAAPPTSTLAVLNPLRSISLDLGLSGSLMGVLWHLLSLF